MKPKAHVSDKKKKIVAQISKLLVSHPVIGVLNLEGLSSGMLQKVKNQQRDQFTIVMAKKRLINIALDQASSKVKGLEKLKEFVTGNTALLFTKDNPFKLQKLLTKAKVPASAKPGQKAPRDLIIPAGPTSFSPGPIIGELGALGIKAGIEGGKVAVKQEKLVAKEGDILDQKAVSLLMKFGIQPMELMVNMVAALEEGVVFTKEVLSVDEKQYLDNITAMAREALNLAVFVRFPTKESVTILVTKAAREANAIADSRDIMTKDNVGRVLAKAERQMQNVQSKLQ